MMAAPDLYEVLAIFLDAMRTFTIKLMNKYFPGKPWEETFCASLNRGQQKNWQKERDKGTPARDLIDYSNLAVLATHFHDQLAREIVRSNGKKKQEKDVNIFNTCIEELRETRNKCQHFTSGISTDEKDRAYSDMTQVANLLGLRELRDTIMVPRIWTD